MRQGKIKQLCKHHRILTGAMKEIENKETNTWLSFCKKGEFHNPKSPNYNEEKENDIFEKIAFASKEKVKSLMEIVISKDCESVFRRAAVRALYTSHKNTKVDEDFLSVTKLLLILSYDQTDIDEDFRVRALEACLSLRKFAGLPFSEDEKAFEEKLMASETSARMRWLMSMER